MKTVNASLAGEISMASREQAQGIEQINKAVNEMDKVVQQNAANAEETASASEEMNAQTSQIKDFVVELKSLVEGSKGTGSAAGNHEAPGKKKSAENPVRIVAVPEKKISGHAPMANRKGLNQIRARETRPEKLIPFDDGEITDF